MSWFIALVLACSAPQPAAAPVEPASTPAPVAEPEPLPDPTESHLAARHLLVAWNGATAAPSAVSRTEDEAREVALSLHRRALDGASLAELAREHSDDGSGPRGGRLGTWKTGLMHPDFERCVAAAAVGAVAPLCRTPFGWHVIEREPVDAASGRLLSVGRPVDEQQASAALERIEGLRAALAGGEEFAAVAGRADGHEELGTVGPGQLLPQVEAALFGMGAGQISDVIEGPNAWFVVQRLQ